MLLTPLLLKEQEVSLYQPQSVINGRYEVIRLVGQGGMSNLYLAHDRKYGNAQVVIKEMTADYSDPKEQQMAVDLFHREAKLLASLNHRHIPKVYDYFNFAGKYYLSMEFIDGEDLAQKLEAQKGPLPEKQVLEWGEQIATVLFYLHKHEPPIVFRDVKPSNIMLCAQGVKLIDFGIARHFDQTKKGDTMRIGSPGYAPPEQYAAQTDPRSDIYSLGVTLHHALTGRDPTATQTPFLVPPARSINPALSEGTAAMLARATQLDPADRYQSMLEMKNDIKELLSRSKQSTRVVAPPHAVAGQSASSPGPNPNPGTSPPPSAPATLAANPTQAGSANPTPTPTSSSPAGVTPSGTVVNPSSSAPTATTTPSTAGTATPATPAANLPRRRKRGLAGFLAVAFTLLVIGGGLSLNPEQREMIKTQAHRLWSSLPTPEFTPNPEQALRAAFQKGSPQDLIALFSGTELQHLSQNKQDLYHLNLLALEAAEENRPPVILHLLYPETLAQDNQENDLLKACTQAVSAVNGLGGLDKHLLIILPRAYPQGGGDRLLALIQKEPGRGEQRYLIYDPQAVEPLSHPLAQPHSTFILDGPSTHNEKTENHLTLEPTFSNTFVKAKELSEKLLWAADGEGPPAYTTKVSFDGSSKALKALLEQASKEKAAVVVDALSLGEVLDIGTKGRLIILSLGTSNLPQLPKGFQAQALVLGSPLRQALPEALNAKEVLTPTGPFNPAQARLIDAVFLACWKQELGDYIGLTLTRSLQGVDRQPLIMTYSWTSSGWVPKL